MAENSTRLPVLADEINAAHTAAMQHAGKAVENAIRCGQLLIEAKATVPHGQWLGWMRKRVSFSERSAQAYMRVYQRYGENPQRVADMSLRDALKQVQSPRRHLIQELNRELSEMLERHRAVPSKPHAEWTIDDARACADRIRETDEILHRYGMCDPENCTACDGAGA